MPTGLASDPMALRYHRNSPPWCRRSSRSPIDSPMRRRRQQRGTVRSVSGLTERRYSLADEHHGRHTVVVEERFPGELEMLRDDNVRLRRLLQLSEEQARAADPDQATLSASPES